MSVLRKFLFDQGGWSSIEYGLGVACFGVWGVIALESAGALKLVN
jgi:Flp pilus assembly pilin Flp